MGETGDDSAQMRRSVLRAQQIQQERFEGLPIRFNSQMRRSEVDRFCKLRPKDRFVLEQAYQRYNMSARGYYKILKVARTIADLEESTQIERNHLLEAIGYRNTYIENN